MNNLIYEFSAYSQNIDPWYPEAVPPMPVQTAESIPSAPKFVNASQLPLASDPSHIRQMICTVSNIPPAITKKSS